MADAVRYCSTDIDGPGLPPSGSQASRLFAILHACLVTGYGDKPGQGWELVHNGGDAGFTLLSPDGVYVCFSSWGSMYSIDLYLAESLAPPFQYPPVGINVRSQDWSADYTSSVTTRHRVSVGVGGSTTVSPKWWQVVARGAQVLLFSSRVELTSPTSGVVADGALYLGNLKLREGGTPVMGPQNFVVAGGNNTASTNTSGALLGTFSGAHTRLRHPLTGVVETGALAELNGWPWEYYGTSRRTVPQQHLPDIALVQTDVRLAGEGSIGYIPGVFASPAISNYMPASVLTALGKPASFAALDDPVLISGEEFYATPSELGLLFVSTNEAYW